MLRLEYSQASDAELVTCFATGRDQRAFEQLVVRHGAMVMGVARRALLSREDAEDAFQATFLALAKSAGKLKRNGAVAAWLYETSLRSSKTIRRMNARWEQKVRRTKEVMHKSSIAGHGTDLRELLDTELARLPPKLGSAVILCDVEGLTRREAAARLGLPSATVSDRVARGRRVLRKRLARRGITASAMGFVSAAAYGSSVAEIDRELLHNTTSRAVQFAAGKSAEEIGISAIVFQSATGVLTAMKTTKLIQACALAVGLTIGVATIDGVSALLSGTARAEDLYFERFDDGEISSDPGWLSLGGPYAGTDTVLNGNGLVISNPGLAGVGPSEVRLYDVSIRAQMRLQSGEAVGITARVNHDHPFDNYFGLLGASGTVYLGVGTPSSGEIILDSVETDLRIMEEDVVLQLDVIGNELQFWAWRPGEPRPAAPRLSEMDARITADGLLGVFGATRSGSSATAEIRYIHVANTSIPEPTTVSLAAFGLAGPLLGCWRWRS